MKLRIKTDQRMNRQKSGVEFKKHSRTSPDEQFKEFSLTKQKLDLERTMNEPGKPFPKKSDTKLKN